MSTALLICAALAVCVLPAPASPKEHRSASAKHEFQLIHPLPVHRADERRLPRLAQRSHCAPRVRWA